MDYLQQLLNNQPVEWKKLGEVCRIKNGRDYKHLGEGQVPVYGSGGIMKYVDEYVYDKPTVLIPRKGSLSNLFYVDTPFWNVDTIFYTEIDSNQICPKFLFHFLSTQKLEKLNMAGGVPSLTQTILNRLPIPIPPLSVQSRIVEILDKFTAMEAELQAELELRKKQYAYYREQLLNFSYPPPSEFNVVYKKLGEMAELVRGNGLSKKDFAPEGIPAIHYGQIYTYYGNETKETISFVTPETASKLRKVFCGNVVITNTSENLEDVGKALLYSGKSEAVTGGHATIIRCSEHLLPKFFVYYTKTRSFFDQKRKLAKGTKVIDVSATDLARIEIPIPPLSEQQRIVEMLDKFDTLTNSISEGLPLEIQLRRQQYEYYREQLLDFRR
jgi:type I restriction/modification specificity protein